MWALIERDKVQTKILAEKAPTSKGKTQGIPQKGSTVLNWAPTDAHGSPKTQISL